MTILIVGGSRGIGAALVRYLNAQGMSGLFTYCNGADRAARIQKQCELWSAVQLDLARMTPAALSNVLRKAGAEITTIVICSAAGLQPGTDPGYAMSVNALGPARLVSRIDDLNQTSFGVLFLTSPPAHQPSRHGVGSDGIYNLVAQTKHAGEALLHRLGPRWFHCRTISTLVVDLVRPSTAYTLYRRLEPETVRRLEKSGQVVDLNNLTPWIASHIASIEGGHHLDPIMEFLSA
ncbi:NAD-dependent epimerase/dehydratase family protein [Auritidibacter ignavus]|uniref:NAD-dependent epimerase/dehydratase family protein n=1 Tax=Auritidibacter ignavus TaxID=678932 RepID=UPI00109C44A2|nr:NAD-dependent epimerase/dehydratase family protein [Auritidibacter ignavus]